MNYDFASMVIGDKVKLPEGKWSDPQRAVMAQATKFADTQDPRWQFQTVGSEGSDFERGQYWLERTR